MAWTRDGSAVTDAMNGAQPRMVRFSETVINDADKVFILGTDAADSMLIIQRIRLEYTATVAFGTRVPTVVVKDSDGDVMYEMNCNASDCPTATDALVLEYCAMEREAAQNGGASRNIFPADFYLLPGWRIRVYDSANIAKTADDMIVHLTCLRV